MYTEFFGLDEEPFCPTINLAFLFLAQTHRNVLVHLSDAILSRKGLISLTGEAGTGKTALITAVTSYIPTTHCRFSIISNPALSAKEVIHAVLLGFNIISIDDNRVRQFYRLREFIEQGDAGGAVSALIVDNADRFRPEVLEEISLLGNIDSFQILLAGRNKLNEVLAGHDKRSLRSRIALQLRVDPIGVDEIEAYIQHRWKKAGGDQRLVFSPDAGGEVARWSKGVPQRINQVCDKAMSVAFEQSDVLITAEHVVRAVASLDEMASLEIPALTRSAADRSLAN